MLDKLSDVTEVGVGSVLYEATRDTEDGVPFIAESYYIEGETADGFRFRHYYNFPGGKNGESEDGWVVVMDIRKEALGKASALASRINAFLASGGTLCEDHWHQTQGCYGSRGWDEMAEIEHERRVEEESRWR